MAPTPNTSITLSNASFIGESSDLTLSFDNDTVVSTETGYGPFIALFLDETGFDGDGDGLSFSSASYLGGSITTNEINLSGTSTETITVHGENYDVTVPAGYVADDTLIVFELPFGSFVADQPAADIDVTLNVSDHANLNESLNIEAIGGFIFGDTPTGDNGAIVQSTNTTSSVDPSLVTITKNYLGPEDETATGPNFVQQYEIVVDIANGQKIKDLDVSDFLPDTMQFVDVASIVYAAGTPTATNVNSPDDDGLTSIGTANIRESTGTDNGVPTPGGTLTRRFDEVEGTPDDRDVVITVDFFIPRLDASGDVIINADDGDDIFDQNQSGLGELADGDTLDGNSWTPLDTDDAVEEVYISSTVNDGTADPTDPAGPSGNGHTDTSLTGYGSDDDSGDASNDPDHVLEEQSIAIQKTVSNDTDSENTPGDILKYTLEFQISDYFAFEDVKVTDVFSDGQRFYNATGFEPTLSFHEHSNPDVTDAQFTITNYNPVGSSGNGTVSDSDLLIIDETDINNTNDGSGNTTLTFDVSGLLATQTGQDDQLLGGGIPDGGFTDYNNNNDPDLSLNNNPVLNTGFDGTTGTITFYTQIQGEYRDDYPSNDQSVDIGDELSNNATIEGAVLDVDSLAPTTYLEDDDTSAAITIEEGNLYKSIYAINDVIFSGADTDDLGDDSLVGYASGVNVTPGDRITYRLTYELPTTDVEDLTLTDYFPLPIFDVETEFASTTFDSTVSSTVPSAGATKYGPLDTFSTRTDASSQNPFLTFSASNDGSNTLTYSYADFDDDVNQSSIVDILVTVTAEDEPAADGLLYTNQVRQTNNTTFNESSFLDEIIQVTLEQPELNITKGVVAYSSDNTDIAFSPGFTAPSGVTFATGGGTTFTGVSDPVSSTDLVSNPINSDLTGGLEAGDIVTFAIVVENTGNGRKGAYDVTIQDDLPTGFEIPSGGLNLAVTDGLGAAISYTGLGDPQSTGSDLFGNGIELDDPGNTPASGSGITEFTDAGALDFYDANSGENLAIITFDLEVSEGVNYQDFDDTPDVEQITNTAILGHRSRNKS